MDRETEFYTVTEMMYMLRISQRSAYKLVHKPDFPKIQIGHKYLIPKKDFDRFMQRNMYRQYKI
ncbi:MAG: helix-turn-helix domain-containing protein [Clostridium sp.]|nr:helix-turn-helix domain-containing protein [Clostridium sp.]MCM1172872.1 helix-turn-helix domain-containing protein [Clostridium sp.]